MAKHLTYRLHQRNKQRPRWLQLRWWMPSLLLASFLAICWGVWHWVSDPDHLPITHVYIQVSQKHVSREAIKAKIAPHIEQGFMGVSVVQLQEAIKEEPWLAKVTVKKVWPDALVVTAEEQQAVARWGKQGVLNPRGEIFYPAENSIPNGLPLLHGPDEMSQTILNSYHAFDKLLAEAKLKIKTIRVDARRAWELTLENNTVIRLGRSDFETRLERLVKTWSKLNEGRNEPIISIDLRYPNGMAVK